MFEGAMMVCRDKRGHCRSAAAPVAVGCGLWILFSKFAPVTSSRGEDGASQRSHEPSETMACAVVIVGAECGSRE